MRSFLLFVSLLLLLFTACKNKAGKQETLSENNIDAARNFIRAALDGKFNEARTYMLQDSVNMNYMDVAERSYQRTDQVTRDGYRTASIRTPEIRNVNDSTSIVIYSNSFKNNPDTLRVVRINGQWLVDLKYLYEHDADTLLNKTETRDTLK